MTTLYSLMQKISPQEINNVNLIPVLRDAVGWGLAFAPLVVGPIFGIIAMLYLHRHPDYLLIREKEKNFQMNS